MREFNEKKGKLRLEIRRRDREWREKKREMGGKINNLEKRVRELGQRRRRYKRGTGMERSGSRKAQKGGIVERMNDIGRKLEMKKREERRNNIVTRRLEREKGS